MEKQDKNMILVIVESPTKSKSIAKFLGKDYKVLSSYGHVRDLPKSELGIDLEKDFEPKYIIPTKARKRVKELKDAAKKTDLIVLATDEDREGEAIAWHISCALGTDKPKTKKDYQRIVFHEITEKAIKKALEKPRSIDMDLVNAQQARRLLDRLVGYKLSPFLWKKVMRGLSAGRVQSVAVRLIVDRERERQAFKPDEYWSIEALLKKGDDKKSKEEFSASLFQKNKKTIPKLGIKDKKSADKILQELEGAKYKITSIEAKETRRYPQPPFTTSTLQQDAVRKLGFSAKQTMTLAQQLYEGVNLGEKGTTGLITYHRTDSLNLSLDAISTVRNFIQKEFGAKYLPEKAAAYRTKSKGAQEAHEAIRPAHVLYRPEKIKTYLDPRQFKLYDLIWRRFVACQMNPAVMDTVSIDVLASGKSKNQYIFRANGSSIKFDGFLKMYPTKFQENILPPLSKGEILKLIKLDTEQHFTQPPARYSEALLIKTLEKYGIGRPSTYAPIITTIQNRNYVQKDEQKKFAPTEIGFIVTDLLKENFENIVDVGFTAEMEESLDKIAQGMVSQVDVLRKFYEPFAKNLKQKYLEVEKRNMEEPTDKICPKCKKEIVIKMGRFGKFYACTGFPECKYTEPIIESTGVKCPECKKGDLVERRTRKGKIFYSCSKYPKCKFALWDKPVNKFCPDCGSILVQTKTGLKCSKKECAYRESNPEEKKSEL